MLIGGGADDALHVRDGLTERLCGCWREAGR